MKVLALSNTYEPIAVIPWEKAISLVFSGKVYTLASYNKEIHSPSTTMNLPSVIVFKNGKRSKINCASFSRKNVWVRDEGKCQYCGVSVSSEK